VVTEISLVSISIALLVCAFAADRQWFDRHFLPSFVLSRRMYVLTVSLARALTAALGLALALVARPCLGRMVTRVPARVLIANAGSILLAIVLALGTSELVLRRTFGHAAEERPGDEEPLRRRDPRLGWVFVPSRTGYEKIGGRVIEYAFDTKGYRVRRANQPVNPERPTIVFTGESVMAGYGLNWDETVPAQVEALLGTQCANLAVNGFATDQAYLRLLAELPGFRHPVAVVTVFIPTLFDRNLDDDRPHLGPELVWQPGVYQWRLARIRDVMFPYRSRDAIERGISVTREVLRATVDLARVREAVPLIVVPEFTPEDPTEEILRRRILDDAGLPYVWVKLDPSWHVPGDPHPDARATHAMAVAIAAGLREH
jgi:hypothetical protein